MVPNKAGREAGPGRLASYTSEPWRMRTSGSAAGISLDWPDSLEPDRTGYHVYRFASASGPFTRLNDLPVSAVRQLTPAGAEVERWVVTMTGPDGDVVAHVESRPSTEAARLTCRATHPAHSRTWHVSLLGATPARDARSNEPRAAG